MYFQGLAGTWASEPACDWSENAGKVSNNLRENCSIEQNGNAQREHMLTSVYMMQRYDAEIVSEHIRAIVFYCAERCKPTFDRRKSILIIRS